MLVYYILLSEHKNSSFHAKRLCTNSKAMFRYMVVRLTTIALSNLMPFPKQRAVETSSKVQICRISKMYCEVTSEMKRYMYGKIATGNVAKSRCMKS